MPQPTIGRRLWYWPSQDDQDVSIHSIDDHIKVLNDKQACDAGVVFVHTDSVVNLLVSDHWGRVRSRVYVKLLADGEDRPTDGSACAQWMPYQVAQAKAAT